VSWNFDDDTRLTIKNRPKESRKGFTEPSAVVSDETTSNPPGVRMIATAIQKPP